MRTEAVADYIDKIDGSLDDNGLTIYKPIGTDTSHAGTAYVMTFVLLAVIMFLNRKRFGYWRSSLVGELNTKE